MAEEEKKKWSPSVNNTPKNLEEIFDVLGEGVALPAMEATDVDTLKRRGTLSKALPIISNVGSDPLAGYSTKALDAAQLAMETGLSYMDTRLMDAKMEAISKAEEKQQERFFKGKQRAFKKRLGGLSRYNQDGIDYFTRRFAGEMLGIGKDLYKVLG